jgi:hypothetical protein
MVALFSLWLSEAAARTILVPSDAPTVEEAVLLAQRNDVILLENPAPYVYPIYGTIRLDGANDAITIRSASVPSEVTDPNQDLNVYLVDVTGDAIADSIFDITNGASLTLENVVLKGREAACKDGVDNDGNGYADRKDPACGPPEASTFGGADTSTYFGVIDTADTGTAEIPQPEYRVFNVNNARLTLRNTWISGYAYAYEGSVIKATDADVTFTNSLFAYSRNLFWLLGPMWQLEAGLGPFMFEGSTVAIDRCTFLSNEAREGGAIYARRSSVLAISDSDFIENRAYDGGVLWIENSTLDVVRSRFFGNGANLIPAVDPLYPHDGGVLYAEDATVSLRNNIFHANQALDEGAVFAYRDTTGAFDLTPEISFNTFNANLAGDGASVLHFREQGFAVRNNLFTGNTGTLVGAVDWPFVVPPDFQYNLVFGNTAYDGVADDATLVFGTELAVYPLDFAFNLAADPLYRFVPSNAPATDPDRFVFWLQPGSPAIDAADPVFTDAGGSRADMGSTGGPDAGTVDIDGDGWESILDCNDEDASIFPFAAEPCDDLDNDCDGFVDELEQTYHPDTDYDGFGAVGSAVLSCPGDVLPELPGGGVWVVDGTDCDDSNYRRAPNLPEVCDGVDNDCTGVVDDEIKPKDHYVDDDGDGFGVNDSRTALYVACPPAGFSPFPTDCNDADPSVHPLVDNESRLHGPLAEAELESTEFDRSPDFVADRIDQDCDGFDLCYQNNDGDRYGAQPIGGIAQLVVDVDLFCDNTGPTSSNQLDCDDLSATVYPNAPEVPGDRIDQNCDLADQCFEDLDGDGYGSVVVVTDNDLDCDNASRPTATLDGDCLDQPGDGTKVGPTQVEVCDGFDNNCDGDVDDVSSEGAREYFLDLDGDGYGTAANTITACGPPAGYAGLAGDCNDNERRTYPGNVELCDGVDNDCENGIDEASALNVEKWYEDFDGDGYGNSLIFVESCNQPDEGVWIPGGQPFDCDDTLDTVGPCTSFCSVQGPQGGASVATFLAVMGLLRRRRR